MKLLSLLVGVVVITVGLACNAPRRERPGGGSSTAGASATVPLAWATIGVPAEGLIRVLPQSGAHGFYGDYMGRDREALLAEVDRGFRAAGFTRSCDAVDGMVRGYSRGDQRLAVKVDVVGALALSIFDEQGAEPVLHGLCFGRYRGGPRHTLTRQEKDDLAKQLEADRSARSSPTPQ